MNNQEPYDEKPLSSECKKNFPNEDQLARTILCVLQDIAGNRVKRQHVFKALESFVIEWMDKNSRSIKPHGEDSSSPLGVPSEISRSSASSMLSPLKDFLMKIFSSMTSLSVHRDVLLLNNDACISTWNRYQMDFSEGCSLGHGGFGVVYKAKHRLDGKEYALKKVQLRRVSQEACRTILREVELLSEMNHPNVVHYFSSWLQLDYIFSNPTLSEYEEDDLDSQQSLSITTSSSFHMNESFSSYKVQSNIEFEHNDSFSSSIVFENSEKAEAEEAISFLSNCFEKTSISEGKRSKENCESSNSFRSMSIVPCRSSPVVGNYLRVPTLYIQMELGRESLLSWIERRNERERNKTFQWSRAEFKNHLKVFKDILLALEYIHSKNIVHRDIKPANVLLSLTDGRVMLTDFGLAKLFQETELKTRSFIVPQNSKYSSCVGTPTYSAPEIANGKMYNAKVDIYSLGIILLELMQPFTSMSERAKLIEGLKKRRYLDPALIARCGYFSHFVLTMTEKDPELRPSATEILFQLDMIQDLRLGTNYSLANTNRRQEEKMHRPNRNLYVSSTNIGMETRLTRSKTFSTFSSCPKLGISKKRHSYSEVFFPSNCHGFKVMSTSTKRKNDEIRKLKAKVKHLERRIRELENGD